MRNKQEIPKLRRGGRQLAEKNPFFLVASLESYWYTGKMQWHAIALVVINCHVSIDCYFCPLCQNPRNYLNPSFWIVDWWTKMSPLGDISSSWFSGAFSRIFWSGSLSRATDSPPILVSLSFCDNSPNPLLSACTTSVTLMKPQPLLGLNHLQIPECHPSSWGSWGPFFWCPSSWSPTTAWCPCCVSVSASLIPWRGCGVAPPSVVSASSIFLHHSHPMPVAKTFYSTCFPFIEKVTAGTSMLR